VRLRIKVVHEHHYDPLYIFIVVCGGLIAGAILGFLTYLLVSVLFGGAAGCPQTSPCP
jgi:predicted lipid-binding transport protein (Tim44 family)